MHSLRSLTANQRGEIYLTYIKLGAHISHLVRGSLLYASPSPTTEQPKQKNWDSLSKGWQALMWPIPEVAQYSPADIRYLIFCSSDRAWFCWCWTAFVLVKEPRVLFSRVVLLLTRRPTPVHPTRLVCVLFVLTMEISWVKRMSRVVGLRPVGHLPIPLDTCSIDFVLPTWREENAIKCTIEGRFFVIDQVQSCGSQPLLPFRVYGLSLCSLLAAIKKYEMNKRRISWVILDLLVSYFIQRSCRITYNVRVIP